MHPNGSANIIKERRLAGRGGLGNIVGNPLENDRLPVAPDLRRDVRQVPRR
jgi:hypothetical protein